MRFAQTCTHSFHGNENRNASAAAGSDPVHTGLPLIRGCTESTFQVFASSPASNSRSNAPHESTPTSSISAEVSNCAEVEETALPPVPTSFPIARSMSSLSDAIPCLQSSCRDRGLIGESGRGAAIQNLLLSILFDRCRQCPFQHSAWSLTDKTIRSCLSECPTNVFSMLCHADDEFETAQSWVVHFGQLAMRYQIECSLRFQIVPRLLKVLPLRPRWPLPLRCLSPKALATGP